MALVNTDAIVLRSYNLAEADRIVVCLTRNAGLVRAVARGARRMKSRFGAALEPYTVIRLAFYEKENRELVSISHVDILTSQFDLAAQPDTAEVLAYIAEMVSEFAPPNEANERLFRMVVACVQTLRDAPNATAAVLRYFEVWLLRLAGLFPDLQTCTECGAVVEPRSAVSVDFEGRLRCLNCSRGSGSRLSGDTQRTIMAIQKHSPAQFVSEFANFAAGVNEELAELTHRLIMRALERRPRSVVLSPSQ